MSKSLNREAAVAAVNLTLGRTTLEQAASLFQPQTLYDLVGPSGSSTADSVLTRALDLLAKKLAESQPARQVFEDLRLLVDSRLRNVLAHAVSLAAANLEHLPALKWMVIEHLQKFDPFTPPFIPRAALVRLGQSVIAESAELRTRVMEVAAHSNVRYEAQYILEAMAPHARTPECLPVFCGLVENGGLSERFVAAQALQPLAVESSEARVALFRAPALTDHTSNGEPCEEALIGCVLASWGDHPDRFIDFLVDTCEVDDPLPEEPENAWVVQQAKFRRRLNLLYLVKRFAERFRTQSPRLRELLCSLGRKNHPDTVKVVLPLLAKLYPDEATQAYLIELGTDYSDGRAQRWAALEAAWTEMAGSKGPQILVQAREKTPPACPMAEKLVGLLEKCGHHSARFAALLERIALDPHSTVFGRVQAACLRLSSAFPEDAGSQYSTSDFAAMLLGSKPPSFCELGAEVLESRDPTRDVLACRAVEALVDRAPQKLSPVAMRVLLKYAPVSQKVLAYLKREIPKFELSSLLQLVGEQRGALLLAILEETTA